MLQAALLISLS